MIEDIHNTSKLVVLDWQTALKLCKRPSSLVSVLLFFLSQSQPIEATTRCGYHL